MPSPEQTPPRHADADAEYYYRRPLTSGELLRAVAVAVGTALVTFYVSRLLLQRTPFAVGARPRSRSHGPERSLGE